MKLQTAKKKLEKAGYSVETIQAGHKDKIIDVLRIDTDYYGPYPTKECLSIHNDVHSILSKSGLVVEQRGCFTSVWIYEY